MSLTFRVTGDLIWPMETVWAVVGIIISVLYGVGLVMVGSTTNIRFAKGLFWASAAIVGAWGFAWMIMTTESSGPIRVIVGLLVGAFVFVVVPEAIRRMTPAKPEIDHAKPSSNQIGNASSNKGIITQGQQGDNKISK